MKTYQNPVYGHTFADPFVLKYRGTYWAYCTGIQADGRCFGMLHSRDLVHWEELGGALEPLPAGWSEYWAPEVLYDNGRFLMYYSVGNEEHMEIRVAVASHPGGPFVDSGHKLTSEPFAIDAHVLTHDDGSRSLFYATDFLNHSHIGTGTVRDRMIDLFTLAADPHPVTRARYDWQVYDPQRASKGGVRWHTIEGSFVLKHKGRYYQMFSGGNWQNPSYGVSYAVTDDPNTTEEWEQIADGERVLPILRTQPNVAGPGHNSVVRGPDNRQLYCVYHFWPEDRRGRVMAIDPLDWVGERMLLVGPSSTPQPVPNTPTFADFFDASGERLGPGWTLQSGDWSIVDESAVQHDSEGEAVALCTTPFSCGLVEVTTRAIAFTNVGSYGLICLHDDKPRLRVTLLPTSKQLVVGVRSGDEWDETLIRLPEEFAPHADHLLRLDLDHGWAEVALDERTVWRGHVPAVDRVGLATRNAAASFAGFQLTLGWQDLFDGGANDPAERGWEATPLPAWHIEDDMLVVSATGETLLTKGPLLESYTLVANARFMGDDATSGGYGFAPVHSGTDSGPLLTIERDGGGWALVEQGMGERFPLPATFDPLQAHQFRFRKEGGQLAILCNADPLGALVVTEQPTRPALVVRDASVAFDMVRVTVLA